jgi:mono/diheme cytochrome c family protein
VIIGSGVERLGFVTRALNTTFVAAGLGLAALAMGGCAGYIDRPSAGSGSGGDLDNGAGSGAGGGGQVPGLPPNAPSFLTLEQTSPELLHLAPRQLEHHLSDVFEVELDFASQLPAWTERGDLLFQARTQAIYDAIPSISASVAERLGSAPFASCNGERSCLSTAIRSIGGEIQRRELADTEVEGYLAVRDVWATGGDAARGDLGLLSSLLLSPYTTTQHDRFRATASHRALAVWNTPSVSLPQSPLADPRFARHVRALLIRWLGLKEPSQLERTLESGTPLDLQTKEEMLQSLVDDVVEIIRGGGKFEALFEFGELGGGVLTAPYALLNHSARTHRSIVFRGLYVYRTLLCQEVPFPSSAVQATIAELAAQAPNATEIEAMRERHNTDTCAGCHRAFDGFGLRLNSLDMLGTKAPQSADTAALDAEVPGWLEAPRKLQSNDLEEVITSLRSNSVAQACFARRWTETMVSGDVGSIAPEAFGRIINGVTEERVLAELLGEYLSGVGSVWRTP